MFRSPVFWKLTAAFACILAVSSVTVWAFALPRVEEHAESQVARSLESQALLVSGPAAEVLVDGAPADRFAELAEVTGTRFTVIDLEGVVRADTGEDPGLMENHGSRPEIRRARETGKSAHSIRQSRTLGHDMMYLAIPVLRDGTAIGVLRTSLPLTEVEESRSQLRNYVATGAAIAAVLGLLLAFVFSRRLSRRISTMTGTAEAIAAGDYSSRPRLGGRDELSQLAESIDRMSAQLSERMATLVRERNELMAILGSMLEGVLAVDKNERILHLNRNAAEILGTRAEDAVGERIWELTRVQPLAETIASVLEDESEHTREARITDGQRDRVLELIASPLLDIGGQLVGAVLVLHDVTELRRLELVRRDFVVNVSHELKTPLTAIRLGELALESGLPEHLFQVLPGRGSVVGERFVSHPDVRKIVFSSTAARSIQRWSFTIFASAARSPSRPGLKTGRPSIS